MAKQIKYVKSDKDFIEKIKSLSISTGAKAAQPKCCVCGKPGIAAVLVPIRIRRSPRPSCEERSFAA